MKKFISFVVASSMVLSLVPATAFAATSATISKTVTVEEDKTLTGDKVPTLSMEVSKDFVDSVQTFRLKLTNAEWASDVETYMKNTGIDVKTALLETTEISNAKTAWEDAVKDDEALATETDAVKALFTDASDFAANEARVVAVATAVDDANADYVALKAFLKVDDFAATKAAAVLYVAAKDKAALTDAVALKTAYDALVNANVEIEAVQRISDSVISIRLKGKLKKDDIVNVRLQDVKATGGVATVEVVPVESEFSSETKTFAKTSDGATKIYVDSQTNFQDGGEIDPIFIEEVVSGTIKAGKMRLKVSGGFELAGTIDVKAVEGKVTAISGAVDADDKTTIIIDVTPDATNEKPLLIRVSGIKINEDGAKFGDVAKFTVSGASTSKETIEVGKYVDFGISLTAAKKDLPVIYAGTAVGNNENNENILLKATIEETVAKSWIQDRKMTLTLPEGVEFVGVDKVTATKFDKTSSQIQDAIEKEIGTDEDNSISLIGADFKSNASGDKRKLEVEFIVSAAADFTGDIELKVSGPAIANEELKVVLGTVKAPIVVNSPVNELKIDYRQTKIADFTIAEPAAGLWEKNDVIILEVEEMQFEDDIVAKVTKGDMKIKKIDTDTKGQIRVTVDSMSSKEPAEITFSNVALNMNRSLAAGDYKLTVKGASNGFNIVGGKVVVDSSKGNKFFLNNFVKDDKRTGAFDVDGITVMKNFVTVTTAGREDGAFTTKIVVPVGATTIKAGTKEITVDAPAYINKDGYTMLPVRAVIEALNGMAAIRWDDSTKTATITFGTRVISMSVGSKVMNLNGVATGLLAAPEISNSRVFLPLRDLGYALGLNDDKIAWDSATSTATLN